MSSPRTGILSLIRFNSRQDYDVGGWWGVGVAYVIIESPPVPIGLGFGTALGLGLDLRGPDLGLGLDN